MAGTLLPGDYISVTKYAYGYSRYSLPGGLHVMDGRLWGSWPERGDIAVFKLPSDNATDYVKRVIGMPGDHIQVKAGTVYLNGQPLQRELVGQVEIPLGNGIPVKGTQYRETLPDGRSYLVLEKYDAGEGDNTKEYIVPPDHFFLMGDNRDDSTDSRYAAKGKGDEFIVSAMGVGYVPFENFVGRVDLVFFSADGSAGFFDFWNWSSAVRWDRMLRSVR
jgi:signal peptidase I